MVAMARSSGLPSPADAVGASWNVRPSCPVMTTGVLLSRGFIVPAKMTLT
jgi:hypothetical protein